MSDETRPPVGLRLDPHFVEEFNANVKRVFTALAQVPQRMAAIERERSERERD